METRWADYENLVTKNVIFIHRTRDVGVIDKNWRGSTGLQGRTFVPAA